MADSTSNIDQIGTQTGGKEITANDGLNAESPAADFGRRATQSALLTFGLYGARGWRVDGVHTAKDNTTVLATASITGYVEVDRSGVQSFSATKTAGKRQSFEVTSGGTAVTSWKDLRPFKPFKFRLAKALSDANYTLLADECICDILEFTGTLTAARDVIVPAVPETWDVYNGTTGGFNIVVKTSGGSGVPVAAGTRARLYCDGTNVVSSGVGGGIVNPMTTAGDLIVGGASGTPTRLAIGASGKVLKVSAGALVWGDDLEGTGIPSGGTTGQVLKKNSATDYDATWQADATGAGMPAGGSTGQVLRKVSGTDYDAEWATPASTQGKHAIYIAAGSMKPQLTNGCAALAFLNMGAGQPDIAYLAFDPTTQEYAHFAFAMPKKWNESTITFVPHWSHDTTATNFGVAWDLQAVAVSDDDALAASFGTAQTSVDTGGTTNDQYRGPESSAITIAGTPAAEDMVYGRVSRVTGDAGDTMGIDARLHGITIFVTTHADTDA